jgi:hypothetical protein
MVIGAKGQWQRVEPEVNVAPASSDASPQLAQAVSADPPACGRDRAIDAGVDRE